MQSAFLGICFVLLVVSLTSNPWFVLYSPLEVFWSPQTHNTDHWAVEFMAAGVLLWFVTSC